MKYDAGECSEERKDRTSPQVRHAEIVAGFAIGNDYFRTTAVDAQFFMAFDAGAQTQYVLEKIQHAIEEAGGALSDVVRTRSLSPIGIT